MNCYRTWDEIPMQLGASVLSIGMFDGGHLGHQAVLQELRQMASSMQASPVVLSFSNAPAQFFMDQGTLPLLSTAQEKMRFFEQQGIESLILLPFDARMASYTAHDLMQALVLDRFQTKAMVLGYDNHFGKARQGSAAFIRENYAHQVQVMEVPPVHIGQEVVSSTRIKASLDAGKVQDVMDCLGQAYVLEGLVVQGKQLGRTLGFPTANLALPSEKYLPAFGVYIVQVQWKAAWHWGICNIGLRPTVEDGLKPSVECHLWDFDQDLYGETLRLHLVDYLRSEQKFQDLSALKDQIKQDEASARARISTNSYSFPKS